MFIIFLLIIASINVESRIDSVIVFSDRAVITRKAAVSLTGPETLRFPDLPGMINDNTVRIKSEGIRIGEVQIRKEYIEKPTGRVKVLKDSIKVLEDRERKLADEAKVLEAKETFLNSVKLGSPEIISKELLTGKIAPQAWREALAFMSEELTRIKVRQIELDHEKEENKKRLDALRKELADIQIIIENRKEVLVEVEAKRPGDYIVELSYAIPQEVSWSPYYELRADASAGSAEIAYYSKISQRTAEDWERVKLVLSTGAPALAGVAPEPRPWYVSVEEIRPRVKYTREERAEMPMAEALSLEEADFSSDKVQRVETGISMQYAIPGLISLKSGEPAKKLILHQAKLPAEFEYYSFPKSQVVAYLRGKLKNTTEYVFLDGDANTYVGGEFTGQTQISTIAPEDSMKVSFGTDERVKVKRELVKTFISSGGFLEERGKREFVYRTTVENFHSREIEIQLIEQVPISQHKDIKVKTTKIAPTGYNENKELSTFTWKPKLSPGQKFTVNLSYYVEYPKGKRVGGLY